jgi:hypothetical protein
VSGGVARRPFDASAAGALIIVAGALRLAAAIIGLAMWWLEIRTRPREEIVPLAQRLAAGALVGVS